MLNITDKSINTISSVESVKTAKQISTSYSSLIINYLRELGIDTVFGLPGGALEPFMNALAHSQRQGVPRFILARHECGAAFMADGYHRETGKMGVICTTTGPGATNLLTGLSSAKVEEIPLLVITAQTPLSKFGKGALQESSCTAIDTVGIFKHVTHYSTLVSHHDQLESKLISAIMTAHGQPKGPVHLSIPSDILRAQAVSKKHVNRRLLAPEFHLIDDTAIETLCDKLISAKNIVVYLGSGAAKARKRVMNFIEHTGAVFITGPMDKGWVNEEHPQYRGVYGFAGHKSAHDALAADRADLILLIGSPLYELETDGWQEDLLNAKLVHIDACAEHFTRSPMAYLHVHGNIDKTFERLVEKLQQTNRWNTLAVKTKESPLKSPPRKQPFFLPLSAACVSNRIPIKPQRLMHALNKTLPEDTRIFIDAGNAWAWATHYLHRSNDKGYYRIAMGFGSMAWSIAAAIGSAAGNPKAPTLCIVGDGSYLMSAQEITVAAQLALPVVFLILNDAAMGMVMHGQRLGGQASIGWELNEINFAEMAAAMGIASTVIEDPRDLDKIKWLEIFKRDGPTLLDVRIDRDEVPPMLSRIKGLAANSSATPGG